jgi:hypothetical protein
MNSFSEMPADSRVWVYQSSREFEQHEVERITEEANKFTASWASHEVPLKAAFELRHKHFLIFMVDEKQCSASGCSIDKSVHFVKNVEMEYQVRLFDRMSVAYAKEGKIYICNYTSLETLFESGEIDGDTIVYNNMVSDKFGLENNWEIPIKESWHTKSLENA